MAQTGKDGAYEVMEDFAKCAGLYDALAEHFIKFDAMEYMSENMTGMSNGAEVTAMYFWSNYSDNPSVAITGIKESNEIHFKSLLSTNGLEQDSVANPMARCGDLNQLQKMIIKELRKTY